MSRGERALEDLGKLSKLHPEKLHVLKLNVVLLSGLSPRARQQRASPALAVQQRALMVPSSPFQEGRRQLVWPRLAGGCCLGGVRLAERC